ncbi:hypothetical protein QBC43DRAFT_111814 [Cladorrhinum sp. PSN259]|nr:hypothetical protein QBC43DRAFT_111814 [Cladorrhinum sp. PSN259]
MVLLSISMDITVICSMAAPDDTIYIETHKIAYMVKLFIEMNLAKLLGMVIKKSNEKRNTFTTPDGWHPGLGGCGFDTLRERQKKGEKIPRWAV